MQGGSRHRSREVALQLLFQHEFNRAEPIDKLISRLLAHFNVPDDVVQYAKDLFFGVETNRTEIDQMIEGMSQNWKVARMGLVDASVMRMAVFEMLFQVPNLDTGIVINEAVELAKKFGSTESGAFVNGILDSVAKKGRK